MGFCRGEVLFGERDQKGVQEKAVLELGLYTRHVLPFKQAYLRDILGSVPDHRNKASYHLFAGGLSCLQFVKTQPL